LRGTSSAPAPLAFAFVRAAKYLGPGIWGIGFRVWDSRFGVYGLWFKIFDSEHRVSGVGFEV